MAIQPLRLFYVLLSVYFVLGYREHQMTQRPEYWTTQRMNQRITPKLTQTSNSEETNTPSNSDDAARDISRQSELFSLQLFQVC